MSFKQILEESKMTQAQLSKEINVHQTLVSLWVRGKCVPRLPMIPLLAQKLNRTETEIIRCFTQKEKR
mgnify:CR=1 FL=1